MTGYWQLTPTQDLTKVVGSLSSVGARHSEGCSRGVSDVPHDTPVSPSVPRVTPPVDGTRWRFKPRTTCASWAFYGASLGGGVVLGTVAEIQLSRLFSGMKKSEWEHNGNGKLPARNARIQLNCSLLFFTNHTAAVVKICWSLL